MKEKKTSTLHIRITPTLEADLRRVAEESGLTYSRWVDKTLTKGVRQHDFNQQKEQQDAKVN